VQEAILALVEQFTVDATERPRRDGESTARRSMCVRL
jgi:hypothetical protein